MNYSLIRSKSDRRPSRARLWLALGLLALLLGGARPALAQEGTSTGDRDGGSVTVHVMQEGESLVGIAGRYSVGVDALRRANGLGAYETGFVGQRLVIPGAAGTTLEAGSPAIIAGLGDNLYTVAARHGLTPAALARANHIVNPHTLSAGQTLILPGEAQRDRSLTTAEDTLALWRAALAQDMNPVALMLINGIRNPALVQPGRTLVLPGSSEAESRLAAPWASMRLHPLPLEIGRSSALTVETRQPGSLTVSFLDAEWPVATDGTLHQVLLPVNRWTSPGVYPLTLTYTGEDGMAVTMTRSVTVADGQYPSEVVRLPAEIAAKLENEGDVAAEIAWVAATMTGFSSERRWSDGPFLLPAPGVMVSGFGTLRAYNDDIYDTFHSGADLGGPTGTPIYAPADGIVVDTGLLDVRGYVTILDHGWGVYTGYWHQSSILVNPGDAVTAGQQIGTIGNTGLSTAAHLHWEMRINGVQVDPMQWVREAMP